jgi:hypothetical protein
MADVVEFPGNTILPEEPAVILEKAKGWDLRQVVVAGWDQDGKLLIGGSHCDLGSICLLLDIAKARMLAEADRG